jgi:predicted DNA-binding ribbon-helix-helix protein
MKSPVVKRSIVIAGHKTSVSLEDAFWTGIKEIAAKRDVTLSDMVATIDQERQHGNLSSAIRLFVLDHYRGAQSRGAHEDRGAHDDRGIKGGIKDRDIQEGARAETKPAILAAGATRAEQPLRAD